MSLSRDEILKADDLKSHVVDIPEWGGSVNIRVMRGTERDQFEARMISTDPEKLKNVRASLVAVVCVDDSGERLFTDKDVEALGNKSSKPLTRIFNKAMSLNGFTEDDVEKLEKN